MKRNISLFIIVVVISMLLIPESIAEAFTIHNGVTFGMSKEEVTTIETNSGFPVETISEMGALTGGYPMDCPLHSGEYLQIKGTIAGIDDAKVEYHFNENGLESAIYILGASRNEGACDSVYKALNDALQNKYGEADDITKGLIESQYVESCVIKTATENASSYGWFKYSLSEIQVYTQDLDNETVVAIIPLIIRAYHSGSLIEQLKIEYHVYSKETIEDAILIYSSDQAKAIDDL